MNARKCAFLTGIAIIAIGVSAATTTLMTARHPVAAVQASAKTESTYERVMRTGIIRCGYTPYSVGLFKDPNTGALQGIYKDLIEEAATQLSLKVVWAEEVTWGTQIEGLKTGRYDMMCSPDSMTAARTRAADYSIPLYFSPVDIWVRRDEARFNDQAQLNDPAIKLATIDGEQTQAIAKAFFPKAADGSLPQNAEFSQLMLAVSTGKADATFAEPYVVNEFMAHNGDILKNLTPGHPLELVANVFILPAGEPAFKAMLDNMLTELALNGFLDRTIDKYELYKGSYVRTKGYD